MVSLDNLLATVIGDNLVARGTRDSLVARRTGRSSIIRTTEGSMEGIGDSLEETTTEEVSTARRTEETELDMGAIKTIDGTMETREAQLL